MRDESTERSDPQWDLTLEIASKLWYEGEYSFTTSPESQQRLVDVHWAALQAGRLLEVRARVRVRGPSKHNQVTMVTVTYDDQGGRIRARAQDGIERLLDSVREDHQP